MGRKKIQIQKISDERTRQTTFSKRKVGLVKKAIELSVLCQCDVLLIGFGPNQIFTYSSADMESLIDQYKSYNGVCEEYTNNDLDSLKPGKITTGCSVVQRKQGVSIPISKKETPPQTKSNQNTPHLHSLPHPIASKPPPYMDPSTLIGLGNLHMFGQLAGINMNNIPPQQLQVGGQLQQPPNQGMPTRKRKSLPGAGGPWISGLGVNDFPSLFNGGAHSIAPLRTPPGGPTPSFSLAPPDSRMMKGALGSPNPIPISDDIQSGGKDASMMIPDSDFQYSKRHKQMQQYHHQQIRSAPGPLRTEEELSKMSEDQSKLNFFPRNNIGSSISSSGLSAFINPSSVGFFMGDPLNNASTSGMNFDSEMHETSGFYRDPMPQLSSKSMAESAFSLPASSMGGGPSFSLASGAFTSTGGGNVGSSSVVNH